jgi:hypothetical protein
MASTEISIKQLPRVNSIEDGDILIVQTENSTNKLDFKDFVIGLENTTFKNTVEQNTSNIDSLSGVLYESTPSAVVGSSTHGIPIVINGVTYNIMLSATA